jgi:tetratricopeptide (TPR) repeat protein
MKQKINFSITFLVAMSSVLGAATAQTSSRSMKKPGPTLSLPTKPGGAPVISRQKAATPAANQLSQALALMRARDFVSAAPQLYLLSKRPEFVTERMQIKYILGVALSELRLNQVAAFQFVDVIRRGDSKYVKQALEKVSLSADSLGDDTLLNYAITKIRIEDFPVAQRDIVNFRLGEIKLKARQSLEAANDFAKVSRESRYGLSANYKRGVAYLEAGKTGPAIQIFDEILATRSSAAVTDPVRVQALMGLARSYYQAQDWDKSLSYYREIPRDTEAWHDSLFESTWASLRSAKFRSTLSSLQSLHSSFYEDYYIPESLLVRGIVYLYICKFEETEKTLNLFEKTYGPIGQAMHKFTDGNKDPLAFFNEVEKAYVIRRDKKPITGLQLPYMVLRRILDEGDVKRSMQYLRALNEERIKFESLGALARTPLGVYGMKVLANRYKNTKVAIGEMTKNHLLNMRSDLREYFENASFIRYETINGKKEIIKKRIAGKDTDQQVDDKVDRDFYIENGYEYWPFDGENWIDELGNYHYLGQQSCEQ